MATIKIVWMTKMVLRSTGIAMKMQRKTMIRQRMLLMSCYSVLTSVSVNTLKRLRLTPKRKPKCTRKSI